MDSINITGAKILYTIPVLGGINITETQVNSWLVLLFVFILCKVLTHNMKVKAETKRQMLAELIVEKATNLVRENMGEKFLNFAPFIASIIALSAFSSLLSVFGLYPPTADINTIAGWAIVVFILITYNKLKGGLGGYLKSFTKPIFILTPFNIISEIATPVSMTFRHFGNVVSGSVVMTLIYAFLGTLSTLVLGWLPGVLAEFPIFQVGIPLVFSAYFDIFSGCLQAYIFAMLTMLYTASAAEDNA
ncbi:MAG: F0F1 ATP synthase subunit A [Acutalibacteraceae bacterium]